MKIAGYSWNGCLALNLALLGLRLMMKRDQKQSLNLNHIWSSFIDFGPRLRRIASVSGGPVWDHRLSNMETCGPFESVAEFHDFLVAPVKQCPRPERFAEYRSQLADTFDVHFAHADLSWENILVDAETGKVKGILDWEMAGFWPEWWEFRKALFGARSQPWWMDIMKEVMVPYGAEADLDMDVEMY
ncbi:hypothetical protein CC79DRAFT_566169 [Sarocladium strictum]